MAYFMDNLTKMDDDHQKISRHQISRVLDQLGFGTEKKMGKNEMK